MESGEKSILKEIIQMQFVGTQAKGKMIFGYGAAAQVGEFAQTIATGTALIIADPIVEKLGSLKPICDSLTKNGYSFRLYSDVKPEPHLKDLGELVALSRSGNFGLVIGVGGGSALDMAKLAALTAICDTPVEEFFHDSSKVGKTLPKILIPTTSGTGSEVSPYIVMADEKGKKLFIGTGDLYATIALVDPQMTVTMPPRVTASTGLDALTHGIEGMTGATNPYTLAVGSKCAELVFKYLPRAVKDGNDLEARYYMAFASVLGMMAYTSGGGLYAHSMSYILTAGKNLPHGAGCGLALPYTMAFNGETAKAVDDSLKKVLNVTDVPEAVLNLVREVGMYSTLSELGYIEKDVPELAEKLVKEYYRVKNPRPCSVSEAEQLMMNMLLGKLTF